MFIFSYDVQYFCLPLLGSQGWWAHNWWWKSRTNN